MKKLLTYLAIVIIFVPLVRWVAKPKVRQEYTKDGKVIIEWYNYSTPEFLKLYTDYLVPEFEASHPDIKIRLNSSLGDTGYDAKLLTLIAGKIPPDIVHITQQNFPFYAVKGIFLDLNPVIARDKSFNLNDYFGPVMDGMRFQGKLLGLPSDFSTIALVYNKRMFDKYHVPYPDKNWDWDKFLWAAKKLTRDTDGDGVIDQFGFVNINSYNRWPAWVWMNGGDILSPDMKKCLLDKPESIEGLKFYIDLSTKYHVAPMGAQTLGQSYQEMFMTEHAAMIADARYAYKTFAKGMSFPWDIAPMPKGKQRVTTFIWGGNSILRSTKHPREAWEFLKFLSGKEGALLNVRAGNAFPAYKKVAMSDLVLKSPLSPPHDKVFLDAIEYGRQAPFPPQFTEFNQAMTKFDGCYLGYTPVDQICRQFTKDVNAAISGEVW
ncbi:MAG TPA: sugar ABC transporter substrate-binding protein [Armatimonadota bacterium]|nr:sugar ABC transporter substrate-binding protein [Armatimonadota bacterium]